MQRVWRLGKDCRRHVLLGGMYTSVLFQNALRSMARLCWMVSNNYSEAAKNENLHKYPLNHYLGFCITSSTPHLAIYHYTHERLSAFSIIQRLLQWKKSHFIQSEFYKQLSVSNWKLSLWIIAVRFPIQQPNSCIFQPCIFDRIAFSTPAFSVAPSVVQLCPHLN